MAWLKFLAELWPDDPDAIAALQEMAGLFLTGEMRHQKAFLIVGPKRSGKGTIARVLTQLLGPANVCGPTLSSLGQNFGLAPLIGKRLAVISDARLGGKVDQQVVVERLLAITGEDGIDVDRKFRDTWTGRLEVRFLVLSNELPRLSDASGAVASRFIVLTLRNSFYGKEDHGLIDKLTGELPGILRWALVGWDRLRTRGYFVPPASSAAAQQEMEDLNSPIGAFLRDHCNIGPHHSELCEQTYHRWCDWCEAQGRDHPGTAQTFGRDLRAYLPAITTVMPRDASTGRQHRYYQGLGIKL
jgi:putative DNA primase/helicase